MSETRTSKELKDTSSRGIQTKARSILGVFIVLLGLYLLKDFIASLLWGGILAIASWPLYQRTEKALGKNSWIPALLTSVFALVVLIPLILISFQVIDEVSSLISFIRQIRSSGIPQPHWLSELPANTSQSASKWWSQHLSDPQQLSDLLSSFKFGQSIEFTRQIGRQAVTRGIEFTFALITFFFLLKDGRTIIDRGLVGSRRLFGRQGEILAKQIVASVHGTLSGLVLVGLIEGAIMGVVYVFVGAPQPLLLGFLTAVAAMIPMLGLITVSIVSVILVIQAKVLGAAVTFGIGAVILFFGDHFVRPALIGGSTRLPFLWVLLGILGGAETWGLLGLFLGPAIMSCLYLLWSVWTSGNPNRKPRKRTLHKHK